MYTPKRSYKRKSTNHYGSRFNAIGETESGKTHTVIYKINGREFYCAVDLPLAASFIIF